MTDTDTTSSGKSSADGQDKRVREGDTDRTLADRPADPNRAGAKVKIPPGVSSEDFLDPGNQTPGAPPVDNRS